MAPIRPSFRRRVAAAVCAAAIGGGASVAADSPARVIQPAVRLTAIRIAALDAAPGVRVILESNGPLPAPETGVLEKPARIYLDLPGVRPASELGVAGHDPRIRGVRFAVHSTDPLVTRVVIDLANAAAHAIDRTASAAGRLTVTLGGPPPSSAPPGGYATDVSPIVARLEELRPVLEAIDRGSTQSAGGAAETAAEFERLRASLRRLDPPLRFATPHDLLLRACALAARAVRLQGEAGQALPAASAAAGALMLIDRAAKEIGGSLRSTCPNPADCGLRLPSD